MSIARSEVKLELTHEVGAKIEDTLEAARREVYAMEGRQIAFMEAVRTVDALSGLVNKDVEAGKFELETAKTTIGYLTRASQQLQQMGSQATTQRNIAAGKAQGLEVAVKLVATMRDLEKAKMERFQSPVSVSGMEVPAGEHRFLGIKERRLAEEQTTAKHQAEAPAEPLAQTAVDTTAKDPVTSVASDPIPELDSKDKNEAAVESTEEAPKKRGRKSRIVDA